MNWSISLWKVVFVFCLPSFRINLIGLKMVFFGFVSASASVEREFKSITHGFFSHTVKVSISDVSPKLDMHVYCFIRWTFPIFFFASHRKTCRGKTRTKPPQCKWNKNVVSNFGLKKKVDFFVNQNLSLLKYSHIQKHFALILIFVFYLTLRKKVM